VDDIKADLLCKEKIEIVRTYGKSERCTENKISSAAERANAGRDAFE